MVFATPWEAQANVEQALRSVTSEQILKMAVDKYSSLNILPMHLRGAMRGTKATFKKHPNDFTSYVPINWNPGPTAGCLITPVLDFWT
jgi:hypothetical protein